jgi:hypothetical protein
MLQYGRYHPEDEQVEEQKDSDDWGASFISSHPVDSLLAE